MKIIEEFYYTYVLQCEKDGKFYTGFTSNLMKRFEKHYNGNIKSIKNLRPVKLIYSEAYLSKEDATHREKYLKSFYGKMFLKNRLESGFHKVNKP